MVTYKVEVPRILKSTKAFYLEDHGAADFDETCFKNDAIEMACQEDDVGDDSGWIENVEWEAEVLYHTPRVGDTVRYSVPETGEAGFRFVVREIIGNDAVIELLCNFNIKPTERVRLTDICLAATEA